MDKGQQFFLAIVVFVVIAFIIFVLIQNFWLKTVFFILDFGALLRVLYEIARPPDRIKKKTKKVCQADMAAELEMNTDGTVTANMVPIKKMVKKKKET
jgi:uncharacterized membrane protein